MYVAFAVGVVLALIGFILIRPIAGQLGAEGELLEDAALYARIILLALPFYIMQVMFQSFFSVAEKPALGLFVTVAAGMTNIVFDAILVILLPQEWKLTGAAIATVLAQVVGGTVPLIYFFRQNSSILRLGKTNYEGKTILKACTNGSSEFMSNIAMNLVGILYNLQLMSYAGEDGVAAYGVMMYVSMIFSAAFLGFTMGVAPIIGYHDGAKNFDELKGLLRKSISIVAFFGFSMVVSAELLAVPISKIFVGYDAALFEMTVSGFRIFALCFAFLGFGIFVSGFFTALNDGLTSALIAFLRTLVFQTAVIWILPAIWELNGVWISVVVAEFMSLVLGVAFLIGKKKKYHY